MQLIYNLRYLLYRNNQDGIYQIKFCGGVDHQHYHDLLDGICAYQHDRDQRKRDLSSFCCDVVWLAILNKNYLNIVQMNSQTNTHK